MFRSVLILVFSSLIAQSNNLNQLAEIAKREAFAAGYKLLSEGDDRISHDSGLNLCVETFPLTNIIWSPY